MHPNPAFRGASHARNLAFARARGFGILAVNGADGPMLSHVPFLLDEDDGAAWLHLVRSNPIARDGDGQAARIAVSGPDGYVSPDWYGTPDQVPTWNYVAVHLSGQLERRPASDLPGLIDRQSALFEARLAPKPPWTTSKMMPEVYEKLLRQIVPFRLAITAIDGTWKLNQNKSEAVRLSAATHMNASGLGLGTVRLADMMRER
jgi:transcriptional regulator